MGQASRQKTHGLFPITGLSDFHSSTVLVIMKASGIVTFAATHILVLPLQIDNMSENMESFLYGVSMKICVCLCDADSRSMLLSLSLRSSVLAGR